MHEAGIPGMAFRAILHCLALGQDLVRDQNGIIYFCMALDAPDALEVSGLIGQPVMTIHDDNFLPVGEQGEAVKVGMTPQAHVVIIEDGFCQVFRVPHESPVTMGIMAFPAGELVNIVNAFLEFHLNILKMVLSKSFIVAMAVHAQKLLFHSCFHGMRESAEIVGMTIGAGKGPVNR